MVMARYLPRSCPECRHYLGVVIPEPGRGASPQPVDAHCPVCGYRLGWTVIRGRSPVDQTPDRADGAPELCK
jgi:hypothetical protein